MRSKSYANTFHQIKPVSHVCIYNHVTIHVSSIEHESDCTSDIAWADPQDENARSKSAFQENEVDFDFTFELEGHPTHFNR